MVAFIWNKIILKFFSRLSFIATLFPALEQYFKKELELENNPNYFEAIPSHRLQRGMKLGLLKPSILTNYESEITKREDPEYEAPEREIDGLESYDMTANDSFVDQWAMDSESLNNKLEQDKDEAKEFDFSLEMVENTEEENTSNSNSYDIVTSTSSTREKML